MNIYTRMRLIRVLLVLATGVALVTGIGIIQLQKENAVLKQTIAAQKDDQAKALGLLDAIIEKTKQNQKAGLPITDGWPTLSNYTNNQPR